MQAINYKNIKSASHQICAMDQHEKQLLLAGINSLQPIIINEILRTTSPTGSELLIEFFLTFYLLFQNNNIPISPLTKSRYTELLTKNINFFKSIEALSVNHFNNFIDKHIEDYPNPELLVYATSQITQANLLNDNLNVDVILKIKVITDYFAEEAFFIEIASSQ